MSERTIEARGQLVCLFTSTTGVPAHQAKSDDVAAWLGQKRFKQGTRCTYWAHLKMWFAWLALMEIRDDNPLTKLRAPRRPRRIPRPVTIDDIARMLLTRHHRRTTVMVLLAAYQGLRVSEIARIRGEHFAGNDLHVIGKGDVDAWLPVSELVAECVAVMPRDGWWFPSHTRPGAHIHSRSVSDLIGKLMRRAGVAGTPHCLRHFYGTESLIASGGNLALVQQLMRHASIATTAIYTKVGSEAMRDTVARLPQPAAAAGAIVLPRPAAA